MLYSNLSLRSIHVGGKQGKVGKEVIESSKVGCPCDGVHELGCYLEAELSRYVGVLRARSTLRKERIRVRRMHGSAIVG